MGEGGRSGGLATQRTNLRGSSPEPRFLANQPVIVHVMPYIFKLRPERKPKCACKLTFAVESLRANALDSREVTERADRRRIDFYMHDSHIRGRITPVVCFRGSDTARTIC